MRLAFPGCESQRDIKGHKETFYIGVERQMASLVSSSNPPTSVESQLSFKDDQNEMLTARVNDVETEVQRLRQSLIAQQSSGSTLLYNDELMSLVSSSSTLSDGPITMECLESFSLSTIIADVH